MKRAKAKGPPCDTCFPGIMPDNETAFFISQRAMTGEGVRIESMEAAMRLYRVPVDERPDAADRVLVIASQFLKRQAEKREKDKQ